MPYKPLTETQEKELKSLIMRGTLSNAAIARLVGVSPYTVSRVRSRMRRAGVQILSPHERVARATLEQAARVAERAHREIEARPPEAWGKLSIPTLSEIVARHHLVLVKCVAAERERTQQRPVFTPDPILAMLGSAYAGAVAGARAAAAGRTWADRAREIEAAQGDPLTAVPQDADAPAPATGALAEPVAEPVAPAQDQAEPTATATHGPAPEGEGPPRGGMR